jgi:hypothetical protein
MESIRKKKPPWTERLEWHFPGNSLVHLGTILDEYAVALQGQQVLDG